MQKEEDIHKIKMAEAKHSGGKNFGKVLQKTVSRTKEKVSVFFSPTILYFLVHVPIIYNGHSSDAMKCIK